MAVFRISVSLLAVVALVFLPAAEGQASAQAPSPTSDGTAIDQGIAYVLMAVALVLTYLIHTTDFVPCL